MPELGALVGAVIALLVVLGWQGWTVKVLQAMKASAPGLFGPLFDALIGADSAIYNRLRQWTDSALQPVTDLFVRLAAGVDSLIANPLRFAQAVYGALWRAFEVTIPTAVQAAHDYANALWQDAINRVVAVYNALEADLAAATALLRAGLAALLDDLRQIEQYAFALFSTVEAALGREVARVESEVVAEVGQEAARAEGVERQIVSAVSADLGQLVGEINGALRGVEAYAVMVAQGVEGDLHRLVDAERAFALGVAQVEKQDFNDLRSGREWAILTDLEDVGGQLLTQALVDLVDMEKRALRSEIAAARELQTKLGPLVRGISAGLRKAG